MNTNEDKLVTVFRTALGFEGSDEAVKTAAYRQFPAWDSIAHMRLIADIESTFNVMLDTDQVIDMSSFDKAREILAGQNVEF